MARVKSFKLKCRKHDIENAEPENARHCLWANIIREQIPFSYSINVRDGWVRFNIGDDKEVTGTRYAFPLPGSALEAQRLLDDGQKAKIKEFDIYLDGREGFANPVEKKGPAARPYRKRKVSAAKRKIGARRCPVRRYKGLSGISKPDARK